MTEDPQEVEPPIEMTQDHDTMMTAAQDTNEPVSQQTANDPKPEPATPNRPRSKKLLFITLGVVFFVGVTIGTFFVLQTMQTRINTMSKTQPATKTKAQTSATITQTDSKIDEAVKAIDAGIVTENADASSADDSLSDTDQQIAIPTE